MNDDLIKALKDTLARPSCQFLRIDREAASRLLAVLEAPAEAVTISRAEYDALKSGYPGDPSLLHEAPAEGAGDLTTERVLARICDAQKRHYGNATALHLAMLDLCIDGRAALALRARSSAPEAREAVAFGRGLVVVNTGKFHGEPAVFIAKAVKGGEIGASAEAEGFSRDSLQPGETVWTFPTKDRANAVADALVGVTHNTPQPRAPTSCGQLLRASFRT